jgi:hypothetical protein
LLCREEPPIDAPSLNENICTELLGEPVSREALQSAAWHEKVEEPTTDSDKP